MFKEETVKQGNPVWESEWKKHYAESKKQQWNK